MGLPLAPTEEQLAAGPHDLCQRCGRPTPVGVGLCESCNPGQIGGPSSAQLHATILAGVGGGFLALAILARLATSNVGPFVGQVTSATVRSDGGVDVTFRVTNQGSSPATATCRVTRGGVSGPEDILFLTPPIPAGATATYSHSSVAPAPNSLPYLADRLVVRCT